MSEQESAAVIIDSSSSCAILSDQPPVYNIHCFLTDALNRVDGLQQILITDRDGVVILKVPLEPDEMRNPRIDQALTTVFSSSNDQTSKLAYIGKINYALSLYDEGLVLQVNAAPLVITFHADVDTNTGEILQLLPSMTEALEVLRKAVEERRRKPKGT
eukprot:GHVS01030252.1.p1 GENE.GHVS01030252.1~~GHVS01030252.1.p1  ORF type:complete len:159 (+),score=29.29 GHVS01030252.1:65-541(+)